MSSPHAINIHILDKTYQISCSPAEEPLLREAADYLTEQMRGIRDKGSVIGTDRVAVMAALNISYDLLQLQALQNQQNEVAKRLTDMNQSLTKTLRKSSFALNAQVD